MIAKKPATLSSTDSVFLGILAYKCIIENPQGSDHHEDLIEFTQTLDRDYRKGKLAAHGQFSSRLLEIYLNLRQFDEFKSFWNWLLYQKQEYRSLRTWATAMKGYFVEGASLSFLQDLMERALQESTVNFLAYRLSSNALAPNRSRLVSPVDGAVSMLTTIARCQIKTGQIRDGYLTLDSLCRFDPLALWSQLSTLLFASRPITETYRLYVMSLRCGLWPNHTAVSQLADGAKMWRQGPYELWFTESHVARLKMEAAAIGVGKKPEARQLVDLFTRIDLLLTDALKSRATSVHKHLPLILDTLNQGFVFARSVAHRPASLRPSMLLRSAGLMRSLELYELLTKNFPRSAFLHDAASCLNTLKGAGLIKDEEMVRDAWHALLQHGSLSETGCRTMIYAARACDMVNFALQEIIAYFNGRDVELIPSMKEAIKDCFAKPIEGILVESNRSATSDVVLSNSGIVLQHIRKYAVVMSERKLRNFFLDPMPDSLEGDRILALEETWLRVYDKLTRDPRERFRIREKDQKEKTNDKNYKGDRFMSSGVTITSTGYRIDDLRYANWRCMNEVILEGCYADNYHLGEEGVLLKSQETLSEEELTRVVMRIRGIAPEQLPQSSSPTAVSQVMRAAYPPKSLFATPGLM